MRTWLEPRLGAAPPELAAAIRDCLERAAPAPERAVPDALARAAEETLARVAAEPQTREAAVRLLAADALLTYAFEAAAETGADLRALADRFGPAGALGRRLAALAGSAGAVPGAREDTGGPASPEGGA